jgi:hypothetical protein
MHPFFHRPGVRRARILFRWCRIFIWLILFLVVAAVAYLHLVGLPDFVKQPLLRRLRAAGIEAQFTNIQLGWGRGPSIIIENAAFSRFQQPLSPHLTARRAELALNWDAMLHFKIEAHSLQVADAQLLIPVSETNNDALLLNHVVMDMRFFLSDTARLDVFRGTFHGIEIDIIGKVSHLSELRQWRLPLGGGQTNGDRLRQVAQALKKINFDGTPRLEIEVGADGRDMNSLHAELNFAAEAAHTPWGDAEKLVVTAACARLTDSGKLPFLQVEWAAARLDTPWAQGRGMSCVASFSRNADSNLNARIRLDTTRFTARSNEFGAGVLSWKGDVTLASSNFIPILADGKLRATDAKTPWGSAHELSLQCRADQPQGLPPPPADWGPWTTMAPWTVDWQAELRDLAALKLHLDHVAFSGHWRAPQVAITNLQVELYGGHVTGGAMLDVASRELRCNGATDFDPHSISPVLKPAAQDWLAQLDWTKPPKVNAQMRVVLPPWTNQRADRTHDAGSTLELAGDFTTGQASYHKVAVRSSAAHVTYTNGVWNVSHLHAVRPEGNVDLDYTSSAQRQDYHLTIDSRMEPKAALPLVLGAKQQHALDAFTFMQPPEIHAKVWGSWNTPARTWVAATILATNFIARGENVAVFRAGLEYTNLILTVTNLYLSNSQSHARAPWLQVDLGTKMVTLTNATGMVDPVVLQQVLRPNAPDWLKVIHFDTPASVSASGSISLTNPLGVDMHFLVDGQGFHYHNLSADHATGAVDWMGPTVILTNIVVSAYKDGTLKGWIAFVSAPGHGSDFYVNFSGTNIDLSSLATGITGKTNKLEGRLDGNLALNGPNTSDPSNLQGGGHLHVHDGLLWDIKIFGLLSPVLNLFSRDWGHSRAREADANFGITTGTVSTDDLVMRCTGFWIKLRGKVDKNKQINARLEAIVSRETPVLGPVLSVAFTPLSKMFEYHITGPLSEPVLEPVFVPRFIMFLLHPFKGEKTHPTPEPSPAPKDTK